MNFDPNAPAGKEAGVFGLPFALEQSALALLPVPWEATTSYGGGTSGGPRAILEASRQVDLYDLDVERPYQPGLFMLEEAPRLHELNAQAKAAAQEVIQNFDTLPDDRRRVLLAQVERDSEEVNALVRGETLRLLDLGKLVGVVGGDHASPLGAIEAVASRVPSLGILHIDAHSDTRDAYEGFRYSHASIMQNVMTRVSNIDRLVQVGIRDVCEQEMNFVAGLGDRAKVFFDRDMQFRKFRGESFASIAREVVAALPERVWISFDIDGLDPRYCPNTGTPVPGGLEFQEAVYLLRELCLQGRTVVGFDLCEVSPNAADPEDEWDGNCGARMLYKLCAFTLASQKRAVLRR